VQLFREDRAVEQVVDADAGTADLVFVAGADATPGGADLGLPLALFAGRVQGAVIGHDHMGGGADHEIFRGYCQALFLQVIDLFDEDAGVDHHPVTDEAGFVGMKDPRGDEVKDMFLVIDHERVAGVVAALKTHHTVSLFREEIDHLALALISPLGTDNNNVRHDQVLFLAASAREQGRASRAPMVRISSSRHVWE